MTESCHIWMSHVTYDWVMSHINESCHIWMIYVNKCPPERLLRTSRYHHVTYDRVMSRMNESFHTRMRHVAFRWAVSHMNDLYHMWMSHVIYEWVMSHLIESNHTWKKHVTYGWVAFHVNESCRIWMRPLHIDELYQIWISHVDESQAPNLPKNKKKKRFDLFQQKVFGLWKDQAWSCHTYQWVMSLMNESRRTWMSCITQKDWLNSNLIPLNLIQINHQFWSMDVQRTRKPLE